MTWFYSGYRVQLLWVRFPHKAVQFCYISMIHWRLTHLTTLWCQNSLDLCSYKYIPLMYVHPNWLSPCCRADMDFETARLRRVYIWVCDYFTMTQMYLLMKSRQCLFHPIKQTRVHTLDGVNGYICVWVSVCLCSFRISVLVFVSIGQLSYCTQLGVFDISLLQRIGPY